MVEYSCYFLGPNQRVISRADFEAESDSDAIIEARALYAERATRDGFELRQDQRLVLAEDHVPFAIAV